VTIRERRETQPQADAHAKRSMAIATRAAAETQAAPGDLYDRIIQTDARDYLSRLHREGYCAHVCLTSPPYWAKREYGGGPNEIGQEDTPAAYIAHVLEVCDLIGQVLAPDGWLFLNLGDTFANQPGQYRGNPDRARGVSVKVRNAAAGGRADRRWDVPDKSLCLIPWRILLALVERGWRCRNVNIWHKIGHQPENVFDRSAQAWEPVLQLTRAAYVHYSRGAGDDDVWALAVGRGGKGGAHPAVFPDALVERVLSRACPLGGVVLDPFAGSGTVLHVAQRMGRRFLGCDLIDWTGREAPMAEQASKQRDLFSVADEMQEREHRLGCGFYEAQADGMDRPWGACDCGLVNHDDD
jgi:site-specific DNA-methyltransferase (cytosine-N4-specific)